ncbi:hypothetical protein K9N68_17980 [Kovacikia minuta CCNUW1]|uniref:hypothetical protein n=1 Tax=Kovacikia minuta TaxID=2931930 RepID=UPI001CCA4A89|nr:hypothetical protein [Kovacikia minuta]UBF23661.1 hypothetical protein K9N68_17980 [Kovacikia minuta CCNUW1]
MELVTDQENLQRQENLNHQESLQQFTEKLQVRLLSLPQNIPVQVQCVVRRGNLMVLNQHAPDEKPDPRLVFRELQRAIQTWIPDFTEAIFNSSPVSPTSQAKLYLRILGQKHPYAYHYFNLCLPNLAESATQELTESLPNSIKQIEETLDRREEANQLPITGSELVLRPTDPDWESFSLVEQSSFEEKTIPQVQEASGRSQWLPWILAGVGVSVVSFAGGMFLMSRPCMIKQCEPLEKAEMLSQQAAQTLQKAKSEQDLRQAQQQLTEVNLLLKGIPAWSRRHGEAQALLQADQSQLTWVERVLAAESQAESAMQKAQKLPQSAADWQQVQSLWRSAIAQLTPIPQVTPLYPYVQQRLAVYQDNLKTTDQYIVAEQQAQKKLAVAKSTANIASARQGLAQSPENWQRVQVTWQVAVNALRQIPNTTTSFAEAQQLLTEYESKLGIARDRVNQEKLSKYALNQATTLAKKAIALQQQNQWTQAAATWRSALNQLNQISAGTLYYDQAQPLLTTYSTALEQAETQLQQAVAQQKLRADLDRICAGTPKTCIYVMTPDLIRVQFTPTYEKTLQQAYTAGQAGNYSLLGGTVNHVDSLQTALQTLSNNAGIPLEVYSSNGMDLLGSFNPGG